ncbi:MAG: CDP-glycerol glycerophosphotransferase family protein [Epsilonproteobacteria bacterium]|nr:CDP-glycerol glycerophosphotransferase family protein [Campylobacterota bacterium]
MITSKGLKKLLSHPRTFIKDYRNKGKWRGSLNVSQVNLLSPITIVLHTGEGKPSQSHLALWVPYFIEAEIDFMILTRHRVAFDMAVENYPDVNIAYARGEAEVQKVMSKLNFVKACVYPSNTGNNIHLLAFDEVEHIFIGHGDSDKSASAHKFFRVYDQNWVAGEAHRDRFENEGFDFRGLEFVQVGRPNLLEVVEKTQNKWEDRYNGKVKLLYLPTWEGVYDEQNYSSLSIVKNIIEEVSVKFDFSISIKLHPSTGNRELGLKNIEKKLTQLISRKKIDGELVAKEKTVNELLTQSNMFICDISAVVSESLSANGPIFVYIPRDKEIKISQSNMPYEYYAYTFSSVEELIEKIEQVLSGDDYLEENRNKAMEYILGREATLNSVFIKNLQEIDKVK